MTTVYTVSFYADITKIGTRSYHCRFKLQLHDAIYRLRFYSNSLIHILSLSNSLNNIASIQKNQGDKSHRVIVALLDQNPTKKEMLLYKEIVVIRCCKWISFQSAEYNYYC